MSEEKIFSIVRWNQNGLRTYKGIIFTEEELDIAIEKVNCLHEKGFGFGLTKRELDIINSDAVIFVEKTRYGDLYGKRG